MYKPVLAALIFAVLTSCSREDDRRARQKLEHAKEELKHDVNVADREIKKGAHKASEEIKKDAHEASREIKKGSDELKAKTESK